jgi:hypothetical protein
MMSLAGNHVTSRFVDHGFLFVFNTYLESTVYRSQVLCFFCEVSDGRLSMLAARGRRQLEVALPFDSSTTFHIDVQNTYLL